MCLFDCGKNTTCCISSFYEWIFFVLQLLCKYLTSLIPPRKYLCITAHKRAGEKLFFPMIKNPNTKKLFLSVAFILSPSCPKANEAHCTLSLLTTYALFHDCDSLRVEWSISSRSKLKKKLLNNNKSKSRLKLTWTEKDSRSVTSCYVFHMFTRALFWIILLSFSVFFSRGKSRARLSRYLSTACNNNKNYSWHGFNVEGKLLFALFR